MNIRKMLSGTVLLLCILTCSFVNAVTVDVPDQKIVGAELPYERGDVVYLNLSKIDKVPANFLKSVVAWKVFDGTKEKKFRNESDGGISFGAGIKKKAFRVHAIVAYVYVIKEKDKSDVIEVKQNFLTAVVKVEDGKEPEPDPDDPDVPTPVPDPTFPDGKYKLASFSYKVAKEKVPASDRKAAVEVAKSFAGIASSIAAGGVSKIEDILTQTKDANNSAVTRAGSTKAAWEPALDVLAEEIYNLYKNKKLVNKDDFGVAWREIASGLEKVK